MISEMVTWITRNKWRNLLKSNFSENTFSEFPNESRAYDTGQKVKFRSTIFEGLKSSDSSIWL